MASNPISPERVEHPAGATATPDSVQTKPDGTRSAAGSTYGDFAPEPAPNANRDPSRGSELERDDLPPDADFSRPPAHAGTTADPGDQHGSKGPQPAELPRR